MDKPQSKIAYPIEEGFALAGLTRTGGYHAIAIGELNTFKIGRRRLVSHRALEDFISRKEAESQQIGRAA